MKRDQISAFTIFQLVGWCLYLLVQTLSFMIQGHIFEKSILLSSGLTLLAGLISYWMRNIYESRFFKKMVNYQLFFACIAICLCASGIMTTSVHILFVGQYVGSASYTFDSLLDQFATNYFQLLPIFVIWSLLYFTTKYIRRLNILEIEKVHLEANLNKARLNTLKGQINPHFLFNNLNNLRALVLENANAARDGLTSLAEVLRYSLTSEHKDKVSLAQEIKVTSDFIALAKLHYESKLNVSIEVQDSCLHYLIPVMSLQMLVENAIKHGIANCVCRGELSIKIWSEGGRLLINVMNPGTLDIPNKTSNSSTGTGLNNITQRLELLYGKNANFTIKEKDRTVTVSLSLPIEVTK